MSKQNEKKNKESPLLITNGQLNCFWENTNSNRSGQNGLSKQHDSTCRQHGG